MEDRDRVELEAAAFRRLLSHLRNHPEVQNIDLMIQADFCRNCLSDWYREAAGDKGMAMSKDESRQAIYGMPYAQWKDKHQAEATAGQMAALEARKAAKAGG